MQAWRSQQDELSYPIADMPSFVSPREVLAGIIWVRLRLPYSLDHVNIYFIKDKGGWAIIDTGLNDRETAQAWDRILVDPKLAGAITHIIATHTHPDHVGYAAELCRKLRLPLHVSAKEYDRCKLVLRTPDLLGSSPGAPFYRKHGLPPAIAQSILNENRHYREVVEQLPAGHRILRHGDRLEMRLDSFEIITGGGHSPEQVMLYCAERRILISADQILPRISPNISIWADDELANPLADYLCSLASLRATLPENLLVLPGHGAPFYGLHVRIDQIVRHHQLRCQDIVDACAHHSRSTNDLISVVFPRALNIQQSGFAFGETLAHVRYLVARGRLEEANSSDGLVRFRSVPSE